MSDGDSGSSLKSGTGSDPWEDDNPTDEEPEIESNESETSPDEKSTTDDVTTDSISTEPTAEPPAPETDQHNVVDTIPHTDGQYPYLLARSSVSDSRDAATLSLPISTEMKKAYNRGILELDNERFENAEIQNTDVAIASMLVGLQHIDEIEDILREWGYGIE
jgi:hypothetical protein